MFQSNQNTLRFSWDPRPQVDITLLSVQVFDLLSHCIPLVLAWVSQLHASSIKPFCALIWPLPKVTVQWLDKKLQTWFSGAGSSQMGQILGSATVGTLA